MEYVNDMQSSEALRQRLQAKFANRGIAAIPSIYKDKVPANVQKMIEERINPFEEAEENIVKEKSLDYSEVRAGQREAVGQYVETIDNAQKAVRAKVNVQENIVWDGTFSRAYARAEKIRIQAEQVRIDRRKIETLAKSVTGNITPRTGTIVENQEKKKAFSLELVLLLAICTVALMLVIFTIAQIYSFGADIKSLESEQKELTKVETTLQAELSERDDLLLIEKIATEEYGMVKSDMVEKNYVTMSSSDRVVLADTSSDNTGFFSSLLSAFFGNN